MNSYYWLGVERRLSGATWSYYTADGTYVGNGFASNASPYAHFTYNYQVGRRSGAGLMCSPT